MTNLFLLDYMPCVAHWGLVLVCTLLDFLYFSSENRRFINICCEGVEIDA